jgi:predicted amidophosphoribosyltransferase
MPGSGIDQEGRRALRYRLCVRCFRAVPATLDERYCINDGTPMLEACPSCGTPITSPYTRFCAACGLEFQDPPSIQGGFP